MMEWEKLLSKERLHQKQYPEQPCRSIFVQDYDRIIFSTPFRRLANKTQVQPLYENDHVHHRLIHSIEVGSVGRSLAMAIGLWLVEQKKIEKGEEYHLVNIVQAACAAHDIGNPPFGHSGESAIGAWFTEKFAEQKGIFSDLDPTLQDQFRAFEGNAQGFRILTRTEMYRNDGGMRLSKAVLGAFMKYPLTVKTKKSLNEIGYKSDGYFGSKKFGIFESEVCLFQEVADTLGIEKIETEKNIWWRRHPLVFVVEAADDICYNILDLEDAFTTGDLEFETVRGALSKIAAELDQGKSNMSEAEQIASLRAAAIGKSIESCFDVFRNNYDEIMAGTFSKSLVEASEFKNEFSYIQEIARNKIFTSRRKIELEVSGYIIIRNILSGIYPVYENLSKNNWDREKLDENSRKIEKALLLDLRGVSSPESALHSMTDFVSGMTDRYALRISRMLSGT